jgi:replicative DNA helicase Mcm
MTTTEERVYTGYDDKTEVLTKYGWKLFDDLLPRDKVASRTRDNNEIQFVPFRNPTKYWYIGKLHHYTSKAIDLAITPDHAMFIKPYNIRVNKDYKFINSQDINIDRLHIDKTFTYNKRKCTDNEIVTIQGYTYIRKDSHGGTYEKTTEDLTVPKKAFTKFLAWYLSDGWVWYDSKNGGYVISISQVDSDRNKHTRQEISNLIVELGLHACRIKESIKVNSRPLGRFLSRLGKCNQKYFPFDVFKWFDAELAKDFIDSYSRADGCADKYRGIRLFTTSKELIDQLQLISGIAGIQVNIYVDEQNIGVPVMCKSIDRPIIKNFPCYIIGIGRGVQNQTPSIYRSKHLNEIDYDGYVYCVEVPDHLLYVRRNGKAAWCGSA